MTSCSPKSPQPRGRYLRPIALTAVIRALPTSSASILLRAPARAHRGLALTADVGHLDLRQVRRLGRAQLGIAIGTAVPDRGDRGFEPGFAGVASDERAKIVAANGEEARVEAAFCGQSR